MARSTAEQHRLSRFESDDFVGALAAFEEALQVRSDEPERPYARELARYAVGRTLRALGRLDEATRQLELAVAWSDGARVDTPVLLRGARGVLRGDRAA